MATRNGSPPVPAASIRVSENLLEEMAARMHATESFPMSVETRFDPSMVGVVPTIGRVSANLRLELVDSHVRLRSGDGNRPRLGVHMDGKVTWELPVGRVVQTFDLRCEVLPEVTVVLCEEDAISVSADFARAKIESVAAEIRDTSYLPSGITQELLGPLGRRFLDGFSREAVRVFLRRIGRRQSKMLDQFARWIKALEVGPGPAGVSVGQGWVDFAFDNELADRNRALARDLDRRFDDTPIGVTVSAERSALLLDFWAAEFERANDTSFGDSKFRVEDGTAYLQTTAAAPMPLGNAGPKSRVSFELSPHVSDGVMKLHPRVLELDLPRGLGWLRTPLRRMIDRGLGRRMRFEVIWQLPIPFAGDEWWQLSMERLDIDVDAVRIWLDAWFPPPSEPVS